MKAFWKTVLAVIVGLLLMQFFFFFLFSTIVGMISLAMGGKEDIVVKDNSILVVDLSDPISDKDLHDPFERFDWRKMELKTQNNLYNALKAIEYAKDDPQIEGILIRSSGLAMSRTEAQELRDALKDFRSCGKFIYAYAENFGQFSYYVASVADSVFMHPMGTLEWQGMSAQNFYLKDALAKWGIEPQIIRHGKYKSAVEPFMENQMSEANRIQTMTYLGSIWNYVVNGVSEERRMSTEELNIIADTKIALLAKEAKERELIDQLYYIDQLDSVLCVKTGKELDKEYNSISLSKYAEYVNKNRSVDFTAEKIALVYAVGEINDGDEDDKAIGGDAYAKIFSDIRKDSTIKAVVLRVNSPGGSAFASEVMWRELERLRAKKPIIVSMGTYAASGGYYISAPADCVVSNPLTLTGSIGVFGMFMTYGKLLQDKLAVHPELVKTNAHADFVSPFRPLDPTERDLMQRSVEETYSTFLSRVSMGRKLTTDAVDSIGQGRVWSGIDALQIGLVDELGGLNRAIELAAERAGIVDNYRISTYPKYEDDFFGQFMSGMFDAKLLAKKFLGITESELDLAETVQKLMKKQGIRAEMPYTVEIR